MVSVSPTITPFEVAFQFQCLDTTAFTQTVAPGGIATIDAGATFSGSGVATPAVTGAENYVFSRGVMASVVLNGGNIVGFSPSTASKSLLEDVQFLNNNLTNLDDLSSWGPTPALRIAYFNFNSLTSLSGLSTWGPTPLLTNLRLNFNSLTSLSGLSTWGPTPLLVEARLNHNSLTNLNELSSWGPTPALIDARFFNNSLTDISGLSTWGEKPALTTAYFYVNNLTNLDDLSSWGPTPALIDARFYNNSLTSLSGLSTWGPTPLLTTLQLHFNSLTDLSPVDDFFSSEITDIQVQGNLLPLAEILRFIALLDTSITTTKPRTIDLSANPGSTAASTDPAFIASRDSLVAKGCTVLI